MGHKKRMCCPKCGHKYGYRWFYFVRNVPSGYPFNIGGRCFNCNAILYLDGKSATFAKHARRVFHLLFVLNLLLIGAMSNVAFKNEDFWVAFSLSAFLLAIVAMLTFLVPYLFNLLVVLPFFKKVGYISTVDDIKTIAEKIAKN